MQSLNGRLETRTQLREAIHLRDFLNQFSGEEWILGDIHPVTRALINVIHFARAAIIQAQMHLSAAELRGFDRPACRYGDVVKAGLEPACPSRPKGARPEPILCRPRKVLDHVWYRDNAADAGRANVVG